MTPEEIRGLVEALGNIQVVLRDAHPQDKWEVYRQLGLILTYHPDKHLVHAAVNLDAHQWGYGACPRGDLNPHAL